MILLYVIPLLLLKENKEFWLSMQCDRGKMTKCHHDTVLVLTLIDRNEAVFHSLMLVGFYIENHWIGYWSF